MKLRKRALALGPALLAMLVISACTAGPSPTSIPATARPTPTAPSSTPIPDPSGTPRPSPTEVTSPAQAAALVFASDQRWAQMVPLRPDMIGQSSWYEAFADGDGYAVNITVGQGDCEAGCIDRHTWRYHVTADGTVELTGEDGEPVDVPPASGGDGDVQVVVLLTAGPTCPVVTNPPDPSCDARPVTNASVTIFDAAGNEVSTAQSDAQGNVVFEVPEGAYFVVPAEVEGLMGTPEAQAFAALGGDHVGLFFGYDTGIR